MEETRRQQQPSSPRGGWITFPFMIGTMAGLSLSASGWLSNLIVYLIEQYNIKSISAAKIYNFVNGSITMLPIVGAILADSFFGCFSVIWFSSLISLLGVVLLVLTAMINHLRPQSCNDNNSSSSCEHPSHLQLGVLYLGLALSSLGNAGTRFTIAPMGADQFDDAKHQATFFNWYIFTMYTASVIGSTAIVYVEDNISWVMGFTICVVANVVGLAIFLSGSRFYRRLKPRGSPYTGLAQVIVASFRKRKMGLSDKTEDYHYHDDDDDDAASRDTVTQTRFFRFLNRAALKTEKDAKQGNSTTIAGSWNLCTVEQVEDLKSLVKILPMWSTGLFLCIPLAIQLSMSVIQALTMDRHMGPHLKIPAGTVPVFILISTCIFIFVIDRLLFPLYEKLTKTPLTVLKRVGIGHALTVISMALSALVEWKRLKAARAEEGPSARTVVPMSVFWLVPQLAVAGLGEAFHFPGQVAFYYQEFPESLKSTSTAAVAMFIGIAFYVSNALIDAIQKITGWLPDDIDKGRLDNVYWLCCVLGGLNFAYYVGCATLYKYKNVAVAKDADGRN